ncbi:MAG: transcription termination/antitermination protein NusG [Lachnospiraceae bacterium]|nr:transcription termination/antitermination protein NusG [Lachnospiraceae bacterium]
MAEANWYVVHTYSGYENKVKANIEKTISNRQLEDLILDVCVPVEDVTEVTATGKIKQTQRKIFPGYVLINMIMNDETWYIVRNTRGVTGFVGPGSKPVPLTADELRPFGLVGGVETDEQQTKVLVDFEPGDMVVVTAGAWEDTTGVITSVNAQKQTVTINVELFGRETPVEINFAEIKKK